MTGLIYITVNSPVELQNTLRGLIFAKTYFREAIFFKNYLIFAGLIFARTGIVNYRED